jgi:hypothetical protein
LLSGAHGYVDKGNGIGGIEHAVRGHGGYAAFPLALLTTIRRAASAPVDPIYVLSRRELTVMRFLAAGHSNRRSPWCWYQQQDRELAQGQHHDQAGVPFPDRSGRVCAAASSGLLTGAWAVARSAGEQRRPRLIRHNPSDSPPLQRRHHTGLGLE